MQLKNNLTMIIHSCDKFSDLWDMHVALLEKNWGERDIPTYVLTDKETSKTYENVSVISAGEGKELSERMAFALPKIDTEYVFVTLDDYLLIKPVSNEIIGELLGIMEKEKLDYLRLFIRPKKATGSRLKPYKKIHNVNLENSDYAVNLYVGILRKSFLEKTIKEKKNAWQYEVSLTKIAREVNAKCAMSKNKDFVILDTVRKGKFLNKAYRYIKKHDLYDGDREVNTHWYEFKLGVRTWGARHMPKWIVKMARKFMMKRGHHYYSQEK